MEILIDGTVYEELNIDSTDMLSAVAALSDSLRGQGRAILSLNVDGEEIHPDDLVAKLGDTQIDQVQRLTLKSGELAQLVSECLHEVKEAVAELPALCHSLAEVFHSDNPDEGYEPFEKLAGIWQNVKARQAQLISALGLSAGELEVNASTLIKLHEEFNTHLNEAAEALQANDCILLGDLMEYEFAPKAEIEIQIVALLEQHAQNQAG